MGASTSTAFSYQYSKHHIQRVIPRWKRILDTSVAASVLILLSPIVFLICVIIKILSPGPIIFKQKRVGIRGSYFMCLKFRTMKVQAAQSTHQSHCSNLIKSNAPMSKLDKKGDSRLIPFAWILRASGFDELPQLINVMRGEMSIVGPRPCLPFEFDELKTWQKERFSTLPGLTGLWQVGGKNKATFEQMIRMDIKYAREKTVTTDLKIILMTIPILIVHVIETLMDRNQADKAT